MYIFSGDSFDARLIEVVCAMNEEVCEISEMCGEKEDNS
jgi:hypothetical protein